MCSVVEEDVPIETMMDFFNKGMRVSGMIENYSPDFKYGGRVALVRCIENLIPYDKEAEESWGLAKVCSVFAKT